MIISDKADALKTNLINESKLKNERIFVAGHTGMAGAHLRLLKNYMLSVATFF